MRQPRNSFSRRHVLAIGAGTAVASSAGRVNAQSFWPEKSIRVVVPYPAGGGTDIIARAWMEKLGQTFGQPFVIENRGGAGGMIGAEAAAKSAPDGYNFLFTANGVLNILPLLKKVPYDHLRSFDPVGRAGDMVCGFVVHPSLGIKSMQELVTYAKKNPGKLAYASSGAGTASQMRLEMLKLMAGVDILHVPYRGGADALTDVLANNAQLMNESTALPHVKSGKLILLNINHHERSPEFPDVPTLTELGLPGADVPISFSLWAPAGTPKEIREKINAKMIEFAKSDEMKQRMAQAGYAPVPQTMHELAKQILVDDMKTYEGLIKAANIKLD